LDKTAFVSPQPIIGLLVLPNGLSAVFEKVDHLPEQARYSTQKEIEAADRKEREVVRLGIRKMRTAPEGFALKIQAGMLRNIQE
jgi:hypothetical protein